MKEENVPEEKHAADGATSPSGGNRIGVFLRKLRFRTLFFWSPLFLLLLLGGLWCVGAAHYAFHVSPAWTAVFGGTLLAVWIASLFRHCFLVVLGAMESVTIAVFLSMTPERMFADTVWQKPWGRAPSVAFSGDRALLRNVRDFHYRSVEDYDVRYLDCELDLSSVRTVDVAVSHWDGLQAIAHTMLSFGFADGSYLAVSMETRLPEGVEQGFLPGLYHQYEILMILATEEDLFQLRTDYRKEELYLYRTNATPEQARELLEYVLLRAESLERDPEFYNSVVRNCTTSLAPLLRLIDPGFKGNFRLLLNGYSDELLFELGYLRCREGESFQKLKQRRLANRCMARSPELGYSERIRFDL